MNNNIFFYDAHAHDVKMQSGGLLIGTEGVTLTTSKVLTNKEVYDKCQESRNFLFVEYITKDFIKPVSDYIKVHPRREQYSPQSVISFIEKSKPKLVVIDTLNFPYWYVKDYWSLVKCSPETQFILAHCGGIEIRDFLKIVIFEKNVWCDFSLTQEFYGFTDKDSIGLLDREIIWSLNNIKVMKKVLFGSDEPYFSQELCLKKILEINKLDLLNSNYENLLNKLK